MTSQQKYQSRSFPLQNIKKKKLRNVCLIHYLNIKTTRNRFIFWYFNGLSEHIRWKHKLLDVVDGWQVSRSLVMFWLVVVLLWRVSSHIHRWRGRDGRGGQRAKASFPTVLLLSQRAGVSAPAPRQPVSSPFVAILRKTRSHFRKKKKKYQSPLFFSFSASSQTGRSLFRDFKRGFCTVG